MLYVGYSIVGLLLYLLANVYKEVFFMREKEYVEVESQIGYSFKSRMLLQQAFTRKSYTVETHDGDNNEVLEFIGDKVLDLIVVKALSEYYGDINNRDEFECDYSEGKLTEIKKQLVESKMLAARIDELGFAQYLIMGKGDRKKNVQNDVHVKEDLFEAILGAVAIDSEWNMDAMQDVVELMLHLDYYLENGFNNEMDYVSLIQQWYQKQNGGLPYYSFVDRKIYDGYHILTTLGQRKRTKVGEGNIVCELRIDDGVPFIGFGYSKSQARMLAAEFAYNYLEEEGLLTTILDEIGDPEWDRAINQLQELAQKGYISYPEYEYEQEYDDYGNPLWFCYCCVEEMDDRSKGYSSSKKDAKKYAALFMLRAVVNKLN